MKVGVTAAMLLAATLAGCTAGESSPHILAPKLVVATLEDGNVTLYVHSAFREHMYDQMSLSIENVTTATRTDSFSLETKVASRGFFVEVTTVTREETYHLRARVDVNVDTDRVRIAALDEKDAWTNGDTYNLPYERIIPRVGT